MIPLKLNIRKILALEGTTRGTSSTKFMCLLCLLWFRPSFLAAVRLAANALDRNILSRQDLMLQREHTGGCLVDASGKSDRALQNRLQPLPVLNASSGILMFDDQIRIRD